ncbi:hypothetical protein PInf_004506 [Phytophthora infestans]|nr:hypothetical protein PInf_004506 [Phytophthora infestans]
MTTLRFGAKIQADNHFSSATRPAQATQDINKTSGFLRDGAVDSADYQHGGTSDEEERMNINLSPATEKWLAGLPGKSAAELEKVAQPPKNVNVEDTLAQLIANVEAHFVAPAENGMTPSAIYAKNNIKAHENAQKPTN